jgi:hypothetical protein
MRQGSIVPGSSRRGRSVRCPNIVDAESTEVAAIRTDRPTPHRRNQNGQLSDHDEPQEDPASFVSVVLSGFDARSLPSAEAVIDFWL